MVTQKKCCGQILILVKNSMIRLCFSPCEVTYFNEILLFVINLCYDSHSNDISHKNIEEIPGRINYRD